MMRRIGSLAVFVWALVSLSCQQRAQATDALGALAVSVQGQSSSGAVVAVHTAAEFQRALDSSAGRPTATTIVLDSGVRYVGNFTLPARAMTAAPVTITSSQNVPAPGVRVDPAAVLAEVVTPNNVPAIDGPSGAHRYELIGLRITAGSGVANDLIRFGYGLETSSSLYPGGFLVDRVIIRGDPAGGAKRGILANAHDVTVANSDIRNIFRAGQDTTTFGCFNCGTGYTLRNNHLEAGGEVVIFGGADSAARTVATNVLLEGNTLTRPLEWRTLDRQVKNLFELKEGLHVVVRGNLLFNHWVAAQSGAAIVITPRDIGKYIQDVVFESNVLYNTGSAFAIASHDDHVATPVATNRIAIRNNLVILDQPTYGGDGRLVLINGSPRDITLDHNTLITLGGEYATVLTAYETRYPINDAGGTAAGGPVVGLVFTNNAVPNGEYGLIANGSINGVGFPTWFPSIVMTGNVLAGYKGWQRPYPSGNRYPTLAEWPKYFTNYAAGDYRPSPLMPLGSDGKPSGVDFTKLPAR
jgi:hypothetical protein